MIRKKKPVDNRMERKIITLSITNDRFLKEIVPLYQKECSFTQTFSKIIFEWCTEYFKEFGQAPTNNIQEIYLHQRDNILPEDAELIEFFLADLSQQPIEENVNVEFYLRHAEKYFRLNKAKKFKEDLDMCLIGGRIEEAENLIASYERIARVETVGCDPFVDKKIIAEAFDENSSESLFMLPGDLGMMIGPHTRDMFCLIVAPSGVGKTFWLTEIAVRALMVGLNVLFVSLEMSRNQMTRRIQHRVVGLPREKDAGKIRIPMFDCVKNQSKMCRKSKVKLHGGPCCECRGNGSGEYEWAIWYEEREYLPIETEDMFASVDLLTRSKFRGNSFKMINPSVKSFSMQDLEILLSNYEYYDGWVPDVIVTDYIEKFKMNPKLDDDNKIYDIVLSHKALSSERNCLVYSASQSNTSRDEWKSHIGSGDFARDIRKKDESSLAWSITQTPEDKEKGYSKIRMMKVREGAFDTRQDCLVLEQRKIGQVFLDSLLI
jgi:hypothetical protein